MSVSLLAHLRRSTSQAHAGIEQAMGIEQVVSSQTAYAELIRRMLGFYEPLEAALATQLDARVLSGREKIPWLRADLHALGVSDGEIAMLPRCSDLPSIGSKAAAYGCAYVVEGSTLGGRQISKTLEGSAVPANARAFFAGYGAETGARWGEFCRELDEFGSRHGAEAADEAVRAALETFATMQNWICRSPVAA